MIDLNTLDRYNDLYKLWVENLSNLISRLQSEHKDVIIVAMARKMPRLIEVMKRESPHASILDNLNYISEQVLPYALRNFSSNRQSIVIVDDAVYYGSTLKQTAGYISKITDARPHICPVAFSEVVGSFPNTEIYRSENNVILEKNIPFFTTQNAKRIIELRRPIDVEFPILRFKLHSETPSASVLKERMRDTISDVFKNEDVYPVEHLVEKQVEKNQQEKDYIVNLNILPKKGTFYDRWNKDFCKMRMYISKQELQVVAYAPGILSENALTEPQPLFSDNRIQQLWEDVQACKMAVWPNTQDEDLLINRLKEAYEKQCVRSKAIWANYLASFLYLLEQKESLFSVITRMFGADVVHTAGFSEEDTRLLLPIELVGPITDSLNRCFEDGRKSDNVFYGLHSAVLANQELIPEEYMNDYEAKIRKGWQHSHTVEEALSVMFSNQHFFISDGVLGNDSLQSTQRLRFGITYTAMEKNLAFPVGINGLWYSIHKWIDKNIDEGTVKPKYERVVVDGNAYWLRMFRAGENEDSFTKVRRLCEFIIGKIRQKEYRSYVERNTVENLLTLVWEDPCNIIKYEYKWNTFDKQQDGYTFSLIYKSSPGMRKFLDFLIDQGYLQVIQDPVGISRLSTIENNRVVTPLSAEQEQAISDYVDAYYFYVQTCNQPFIMNSFFSQNDEMILARSHDKLILWHREFADYMQKAVSSEYIQNDTISTKFASLDKSLKGIIQETKKIIDIAVEDSKNIIRQEIWDHLQIEKYEQFKKELIATIVVQELFYQIFLVSEEEKDSVETLERYLHLIQEDEEETGSVILNFFRMSDADRNIKENQNKVICALKEVLDKHVK